ncbi:MAG TPA: hydrogenase nickel incorporation protein HypB [Smithellaceae bacterium]|nr:MAG: Hydrogenase isoenzymes nickel incorporation protein HypB [Deltaproteobacteria bacterium ADurb.BinA014]HNQ18365.1 hydrogenase nickel incorporation protein HypB [Smithellaceae bacterium]HNT90969.1 hydrogenase nickel incorporation protein HypB [Smithellaceae bacterium]HNV64621.1 hydrogenase nickel incorporation protein HypB [Smithellaceae bacterium]HNZ32136.1 hydrogenase nickel incorporation protein HypB [Smithellaceae bacterium]
MAEIKLIEVKEEILADNIRQAASVRDEYKRKKTMLLNLMSSPGSGKTSLILRTVEAMKDSVNIGVIEADIDSIVDAEKVAATGIPAVQLRTGGFCHLDAAMVTQGLDALAGNDLDLIIIENVGNLVCPAEFDTGAHKNVMILSVPEGDDKPLKYPLMFSVSDLLLVNKIDYLALSDFDIVALRKRALTLNPRMAILEISCRSGAGIEEWIKWLRQELGAFRK